MHVDFCQVVLGTYESFIFKQRGAVTIKLNKEESVIVSVCGEQTFICVRFKAWGDSKWKEET